MPEIKTQQRISVTLDLDADEAKDLHEFLDSNVTDDSANNVLAIHQALGHAINGKPKKERDPNAPKPGRKSKEEKDAAAALAATITGQTGSAPAALASQAAPAQAAAPVQKTPVAAAAPVQKKVAVAAQ